MGLYVNPIPFQNDEKGRTTPFARLSFYESGTFNPKNTYSDLALTSVNPNPVVADGAGRFPQIFMASDEPYRVVFSTKKNASEYTDVWTTDEVTGSVDATATILTLNSIADFYQFTGSVDGQQVSLVSVNLGQNQGGDTFAWDADGDKSTADGYLVNDPSVTLTNQGTGSGTGVWRRRGKNCYYLEDFGVSSINTDLENGAAYIKAVESANNINTISGPYSFDFSGLGATSNFETISIDLGSKMHIFKNFGGLVANSCKRFSFNGFLDANGTPVRNIIEGDVLEIIEIDNIHVENVFALNPTIDNQIHLFEWQHVSEIDFQLSCKNAYFKSIVTQDPTIPMTLFGQFGSASTLTTQHNLTFGNFYVENFYSVDTDGATIIDGESDCFRMFNNPCSIHFDNLQVINVAKRFLKSQEECYLTVDYCNTTLDNRFIGSTNHIGTFEAQNVNQLKPSRFVFDQVDADYSAASGTPIFFNASGNDHECVVNNIKYSNIGVFNSSNNILFHINNGAGDNLRINAVNSNRIKLKDFTDTDLQTITSSGVEIDGFQISSPTHASTNFLMTDATLKNGEFSAWSTDNKIALTNYIKNIKVTYTSGTTDGRPFRPEPSKTVFVEQMQIDNQTATSVIYWNDSVNSGEVIFRDFRSNLGQLAFFSGGTWDIVIDNCNDGTVTGAGVNSLLTATYT